MTPTTAEPPFVESRKPLTLVGGGHVTDEDFVLSLGVAPEVVAADGGTRACLVRGILPRAVIGDMDSILPEDRAALAPGTIHELAEQDTTDFDKVLRSVSAPLFIGVGFLGARLDHELASLGVLLRHPDKKCILLGSHDVIFTCPARIDLQLPIGNRFSLFPFGSVMGRSEGLRWPIDGLRFNPLGQLGTSNEVTGPVILEMDGPQMLVILPRDALAEAVNALKRAPAWPPA
ncbi:thiamine diphosphokinase [Poseidonocella pacifica]|uniref:Thiamine diphosphokinase n=1 Tax=Poseidonocella pacifica TaxID=871651 RepID=A0A1I0X2C9_9RHOB|nr:thiamine diphosphokinase [Poseidonocella pacifica]SFA94817.1 thiamine diphosphokinase [Poseidonocella pacifica]